MMQTHSEPQTLSGYVRILRRRRRAVLQMLILGPLVALLVSIRQTPQYEASAGVLLSLQPTLTQASGVGTPEDPARVVLNQAQVARALPVARRVVGATGNAFPNATQFLRSSHVATREGVDLLTFSVNHRSPKAAIRSANEYATQFIVYLQNFETSSVTRALAQVNERIAALRAHNERKALYDVLQRKQQELQTLQTLQTPTASLVERAATAEKVRPRVVRNIVLGLGLGLLLGLGTAFMWEALDSRIRSEEEIAEVLGLPLLGRVREPKAGRRLAMLHDPESTEAETYRTLRIGLDTVSRRIGARSVLVTSAVDGEGRTTTIANLAVAEARAGRRVVLVDFDLRYPSLGQLFDLEGRPGVTDVVLGHVDLDEALAEVPLAGLGRSWELEPRVNGNGHGGRAAVSGALAGSLHVLTAGPVSPELRELLVSPVVAELVEQLHERADVVLIDAPPMVPIGDAQALGSEVDALLVVVRFSITRRRLLKELRRTLELSAAPALGLVLVEAERDERAAYSGFYRPRRSRSLQRRVLAERRPALSAGRTEGRRSLE
jgi:succinoglycan biosynthesis transport protein ExoP